MTENKRYSFNWERGHPQFWDNHCDLADCYLTCEDVCELLNELHEENQNTKAILNDFMSILNRLQANPTDKKLLGIARDMLQNMGVDLDD